MELLQTHDTCVLGDAGCVAIALHPQSLALRIRVYPRPSAVSFLKATVRVVSFRVLVDRLSKNMISNEET